MKKVRDRYRDEERKKVLAAEREVNIFVLSKIFITGTLNVSKEIERKQHHERLEKAKSVTITQDASLPTPKVVRNRIDFFINNNSRNLSFIFSLKLKI